MTEVVNTSTLEKLYKGVEKNTRYLVGAADANIRAAASMEVMQIVLAGSFIFELIDRIPGGTLNIDLPDWAVTYLEQGICGRCGCVGWEEREVGEVGVYHMKIYIMLNIFKYLSLSSIIFPHNTKPHDPPRHPLFVVCNKHGVYGNLPLWTPQVHAHAAGRAKRDFEL